MKYRKRKMFFDRKQKVSCSSLKKLYNEDVGLNSFWFNFWEEFCKSSTLHGIGYLARQDRPVYERIIWANMIILAVLSASFLSNSIWTMFTTSTTATVVESTRYGCDKIPFPSVTICDSSRVDWEKITKLKPKDIPTLGHLSQNTSMENIRILLKSLAEVTFGDFDFLEILNEAKIKPEEFKHIEVSKLLQKVQRSCSDIFQGSCWWRDKFYDCCTIFELQRTDFGFCYSFNNDLSEEGKLLSNDYGTNGRPDHWLDKNNNWRPRRSATHGPWSGLRVTVKVMDIKQLPPKTNISAGVQVFVNGPRHFPHGDNFRVATGMTVDIGILGDTLRPENKVRRLAPNVRNCLFFDEKTSWTGIYQEHNCIAECRRDYALLYCNCSPDFLFFNDDNKKYPACDVSGLMCLRTHNDVFNSMIPSNAANNFFESNGSGMHCDCLPDCASQQYVAEVSTSHNINWSSIAVLDFHYRLPYNILYRTDIIFDWLDLIVGFGGVAGICLGGSVLSGAEIIYFFTCRLYYHWSHHNHNLNAIKRRGKINFVAKNKY